MPDRSTLRLAAYDSLAAELAALRADLLEAQGACRMACEAHELHAKPDGNAASVVRLHEAMMLCRAVVAKSAAEKKG